MKSILTKALSVLLIFLMVSPFCSSFAVEIDNEDVGDDYEWAGTGSNASVDDEMDNEYQTPDDSATYKDSLLSSSQTEIDEEKLVELRKNVNPFERALTDFGLDIGDYAQDYMSQIFREELTIDTVVFNDSDMLNANFFDNSVNPANSLASQVVKDFINKWFSYFRNLSLVVVLCFLVIAGIRIILGTAKGKAGAYESLKQIIIAVMLIFFFPYVIRIVFNLNDALVTKIKNYTFSNVTTSLGGTISPESDLQKDELEFRSPIYVSLGTNRISTGSEEATRIYLSKVKYYSSKADMMRIMRAYAGLTGRFMYVIIWYIMLVQLYILVVVYIKRYFTIAVLLITYPLVVIGYVSGKMFGNSQTAFNSWCSKFISTVLLQSIHAIIYGITSSVMINQIRVYNGEIKSMNWILMIIATSFLFSGEKILSRLFNSSIDSSADRTSIKHWFGAPKRIIGIFK